MSDAAARLNTALEGRYAIERELGEGGMATVYLADDLKHGRKVALKVLKPELAAVLGAERFLAEIKTTANLQHPHILPLFDSGEAESFLYYVMPHVEGESLRERLDRDQQLPVDEAVRIATNMAEALDYSHRQGVIHRDIKPDNVLIHDGQPVITDFGIALAVGGAGGGRLTETGLSLGTPHYMSPEQAAGGQHLGPATDIYALGCVLYEMLVGEPPFTGSTPQAILGKIIAGERVSAAGERETVPTHVDAAIAKALAKLPADRFTSAARFAEALGDPSFMTSEPTPAAMSTFRTQGLGRVAWPAVAVVAIGLSLWGWMRPQPRQPVARMQISLPEDQRVGALGPRYLSAGHFPRWYTAGVRRRAGRSQGPVLTRARRPEPASIGWNGRCTTTVLLAGWRVGGLLRKRPAIEGPGIWWSSDHHHSLATGRDPWSELGCRQHDPILDRAQPVSRADGRRRSCAAWAYPGRTERSSRY